MVRKFFGLFAFFAALCLCTAGFVGCADDDEGVVISRVTEDGEEYSPKEVWIHLANISGMDLRDMKVVRLDFDLEAVDTVDFVLVDKYYDYYKYRTGSAENIDKMEFYSPYIKVIADYVGSDSSSGMPFEYYVDITADKDETLDAPKALVFNRVENLVKKQNYSLKEALSSAYSFADSLFDRYNVMKDLRRVCRSDVYDSTFFENFKELRDVLTENNSLPVEIAVEVADWILSKQAPFGGNQVAGSLEGTDKKIVECILGIDSCGNGNDGKLDTIKTSGSKYEGTVLVCESQTKNYTSKLNFWRPQKELEKKIGKICTYENLEEVTFERVRYRCNRFSSDWEALDDTVRTSALMADAKVSAVYGKCGEDLKIDILRYYGDKLYICRESDGKSLWDSDSNYINSVFPKEDKSLADYSFVEAYNDARVALEFGNCTEEREGEKNVYGTSFYSCKNLLWTYNYPISYDIYFCNSSDNGRKKEINLGGNRYAYVICDGNDWSKISVHDYYGDVCNQDSIYRVVKHNDSYYRCNGEEYEELSPEEVLPPMKDRKSCGGKNSPEENTILKYDSTYYTCTQYGWVVSAEKDLVPPVLNGAFCTSANRDSVVKVEDEYYYCGYDHQWKKTDERNYQKYVFWNENKSLCSKGIKGTSLLWNDYLKTLYGCAKDSAGKKIEFREFVTGSRGANKVFAGGKFVSDALYQVADGDFTYELVINLKNSWYSQLLPSKVYEGSVDGANYKYDLWSVDSTTFIHPKRSDDSKLLSEIDNKSESFEEFFKSWDNRVSSGYWSHDEPWEASVESVLVTKYSDQSFMDYATASAFCPKGYHIPDTTEWIIPATYPLYPKGENYFNHSLMVVTLVGEGDNGKQDRVKKNVDVFWSSTSKDENTQYCAQFEETGTGYTTRAVILECPRDVYPFVQAMCVKD